MKTPQRFISHILGLVLIMGFGVVTLNSCGGSATKEESKEQAANSVDDAEFYATQPVHSGLYDASYYDITGKNDRKGQFDGRIYFSLSPEISAIYVFENGNRTKIDCTITLQKPFEKNDSGVYCATDSKDRLVTVTPDSVNYVLDFQNSEDNYKITFSPKPRFEGSALDILEKITSQKKKASGK